MKACRIEIVGTIPKDFALTRAQVKTAAAFFAAQSQARLAGTVPIESRGTDPGQAKGTVPIESRGTDPGQAKGTVPWQEVVVHLVHDAESDACHQAIMGIAGATDVITQAYDAIPPEEPGLFGELIVNVDQARRAAPKRANWTVAKELLLYIAHGMDHLSGADDHEPADYARMRRRELQWLRKFAKL